MLSSKGTFRETGCVPFPSHVGGLMSFQTVLGGQIWQQSEAHAPANLIALIAPANPKMEITRRRL